MYLVNLINQKIIFVILITLVTVCLAQFGGSGMGSNPVGSDIVPGVGNEKVPGFVPGKNSNDGMPGVNPSSFLGGSNPKYEIPGIDLGKILNFQSQRLPPNNATAPQSEQNETSPSGSQIAKTPSQTVPNGTPLSGTSSTSSNKFYKFYLDF
jgi:hypothetical protein